MFLILFLPLHLFQQVVLVYLAGMLLYFNEWSWIFDVELFIPYFFGFDFSSEVIEMSEQEREKVWHGENYLCLNYFGRYLINQDVKQYCLGTRMVCRDVSYGYNTVKVAALVPGHVSSGGLCLSTHVPCLGPEF